MRKQSGFTLIELMVVMAIIAILATAGLSAFTGYLKKGRDTARVGIANQVNTAVNALMGSNGGVPPTDEELLAELETMNMAHLEVGSPTYLSSISPFVERIGDIIGISSLFAEIREPSGGKLVCLGYGTGGAIIGGQSCAFRYIVYGDGTYVIAYGVEHESSLQKNFYKIATVAGGTTSKYMQVVGTAGYVGTPSIGEAGAPLKTTTTPFSSSQVVIEANGATVTNGEGSAIDESRSALLSTESSSGVDACNNECMGGQVCDGVDTCVNVCDNVVCLVGQVCGATSNSCTDLCGGTTECTSAQQCVNGGCQNLCGGVDGQLCGSGLECVAGDCVTPDACTLPGVQVGDQCGDGTIYLSDTMRTTPADTGGTSNYSGAVTKCTTGTGPNNTNLGGYTNWRLPATSAEFVSLIYNNKSKLSGFDSNPGNAWYWTSFLTGYSMDMRTTVRLVDGNVSRDYMNSGNYLYTRCVRNI